MTFIYLEDLKVKIAQKRLLESTEHWNGKETNFRFG